MTDKFTKDCKKTEMDYMPMVHGLKDNTECYTKRQIRLHHLMLGVVTESGELADALKKTYYGKPLDRVNVMEETGDILYYLSLVGDELGFTLEECMSMVSAKLAARYPSGYSNESATNRNLGTEREILENN